MSDVDFNWVKLFDSLPDACLILDRDLVMVHANRAYTQLADKTLAELLGHRVDEVFAVNPEDPDAAERLYEAYGRVLRTGTGYRMGVVRYDFPDGAGGFTARYWSATLSPVEDTSGAVAYVAHRASEVTDVHSALQQALSRYTEQLGGDALLAQAEDELLEVRDTADVAAQLLAEVEQMHHALESRAGIEQAKGIVMAGRRCTPDEAFAVLRELSQHANRKLRAVAEEIVATTTVPPLGGASAPGGEPQPSPEVPS